MLLSPDESVYRSAEARPSSLHRHRRKLLASPRWLLLFGGYGLYAWGTGPRRPPGTSNGEKAKRRTMVRRQTHRSRPFWIVAASAVVVDLYGVAG